MKANLVLTFIHCQFTDMFFAIDFEGYVHSDSFLMPVPQVGIDVGNHGRFHGKCEVKQSNIVLSGKAKKKIVSEGFE